MPPKTTGTAPAGSSTVASTSTTVVASTPAKSSLFDGTLKSAITQGGNGKHVYSNAKAMYGYVDAKQFMFVPKDMVSKICGIWSNTKNPKVDLKALGKKNGIDSFVGKDQAAYVAGTEYLYLDDEFELIKLAALNYVCLKESGMDNEVAIIASIYRARWTALGCLYTESNVEIKDSTRQFEEIKVVDGSTTGVPTGANDVANATDFSELETALGADAVWFGDYFVDGAYGSKYVVKTAENFWAISEYLFRTRGHHFKEGYIGNIKKMIESSYQGSVKIDDNFPFAEVFHTAIHPFGIKALPTMAAHFAAHDKLGSSMLMRFNSAPNGAAAITTSKAALDCMETESWFPRFKAMYKDAVVLVEKLSDAIVSDKYAYHMAAGLYGCDKVNTITIGSTTFTLEEAKAKATPIATAAQGFINALEQEVKEGNITGFSLSNAEALKKIAEGNPVLSMKISTLVSVGLDALASQKSIAEATKSAFPVIAAASESTTVAKTTGTP